MEAKELIEIGLTKNQAEVYFEIIKHPYQPAGSIAKALSIDRSFTYGIINSLLDKGLVKYLKKNNSRLYCSTNPENLLKEIEEKRDKINKVVEEIKSIRETKKTNSSVAVYEGKAGLKAYIRDFLSSDFFETLGGGENLRIFEVLKYEYPHYLKELSKKKSKGRIITSLDNKKKLYEIYKKSQVKIRSFKGLKGDVSFTMFKNKLAIYSAEEKPFVIMIENQKITESLRNYFNKLWNLTD